MRNGRQGGAVSVDGVGDVDPVQDSQAQVEEGQYQHGQGPGINDIK